MSEFFLNSDNRVHIQHLKSKKQYDINHPELGITPYSGNSQYYDEGLYPNLPTVEDLMYGEIVLNVAPGTETIAIKNYNGDIVFIPFNVAQKIQKLNKKVDDNYVSLKNYTDERISVFSGETLTRFDSLEDLIFALTNETLEHFDRVETDINELSAYTHSNIDELKGRVDEHDGILDGLSDQIEEISQNVVAGTDSRLNELSAYTVSEVERIDGNITELDNKIDSSNSGLTKTIDTMNKSLGFKPEGIYDPTSDNLKSKNVTQSLDYIDQKLDEDILSGETRYKELIKIILEDEKVTANFAAIINNSCGFDINAIYRPYTEFLKGLTVTQAIDTLYSVLEGDIDTKIDVAKEDIYANVDNKLFSLSGAIINYVDFADSGLSNRIDELEAWFGNANKQYLETTVTYDILVDMMVTGRLKWGMLYRLTDYQATICHADPNAGNASLRDENINYIDPNANNGFEILLRATSNHTFNENALAMYSPYIDTPNPNERPECWEIKYSLLNDDRASWGYGGEFDKGKGFIYYMKDQWGNEAPFDFKNIKTDGHFLFEDLNGNEASSSGDYKNNVIKPAYTEDGRLKLNNIHFIGAKAEGNEFKVGCEDITIYGTFNDNVVSPTKNGSTLSNKENTFLGFNFE